MERKVLGEGDKEERKRRENGKEERRLFLGHFSTARCTLLAARSRSFSFPLRAPPLQRPQRPQRARACACVSVQVCSPLRALSEDELLQQLDVR